MADTPLNTSAPPSRPDRWVVRLYQRARHPAFGALTAVSLAGVGLLGSIYSQDLVTARLMEVLFGWLPSSALLLVLAVGFTFVSLLLFIGIGARRAEATRQVRQFEGLLSDLRTSIGALSERTADLGRQADALTADQEKIRHAVLLIPDVNMATPFAALIRASKDAVDLAYTGGFDPAQAEKATRRVLTDLADVVYAYQRTNGALGRAPLRVGVNVQFHVDAAAIGGLRPVHYNGLSDRLRFRNATHTLRSFAGVLDVRRELSACRQGEARDAPDPDLDAFALPVPDATVGDPVDAVERHDERELPHLPGAPFALAARAFHRYPDARALLAWTRHHPAYDARARDDVRAYVEQERDRVQSFAAIPLRAPGALTGAPLAVLSIHANRTGDFGSDDQLAEFVSTAKDLLDLLRRPVADLHAQAYA